MSATYPAGAAHGDVRLQAAAFPPVLTADRAAAVVGRLAELISTARGPNRRAERMSAAIAAMLARAARGMTIGGSGLRARPRRQPSRGQTAQE
jgi:hypothetical protein